MSTPSARVPRTPRPRLSRQKEAGLASRAETSRRLLTAAGQLFAEQGYVGATVTGIAQRAGVSLQTLYLAWGSKRRLLRAYVEDTMTGSATAITDDTWAPAVRAMVDAQKPTAADGAQVILALAHTFRVVAERVGPVWKVVRDAAAVDPDIAADHTDLETQRRHTLSGVLDRLDDDQLRAGLSRREALDTMMVIASPQSYDLLVNGAGYSLDALEQWVGRTLVAALLSGPRPTAAPSGTPGRTVTDARRKRPARG